MTGKLELGGSNPLPPTYSRLTDCAGYMFDCDDYGALGFFCRWLLSAESLKIVISRWMPPFLLRLSERWTYISLSMVKIYCIPVTDVLWYDLLTNTAIARHMVMNCLSCALTHSLPLNMKCVPCLDPEFDTANHHDYALLCNYTHNICTLHKISWPRMHSCPKDESLHTFCKTHDTYKNVLKC